MNRIPISRYAQYEHAYKMCPDIARVIYPERQEVYRNTAARPGATADYLYYKFAVERYEEQSKIKQGSIVRTRATFDGECCWNCEYFRELYRVNSDGDFCAVEEGRCTLKSGHGRPAKRHSCCSCFKEGELFER